MNFSGCVRLFAVCGSELSNAQTSPTQGEDLSQRYQLWWMHKLVLVDPCCPKELITKSITE